MKMFDEDDVMNFRRVIAAAFDFRQEMVEKGVTQDNLDQLREMSLSSDLIPKGNIDLIIYIFFSGCRHNFDKTVTLLHNYFKLVRDAPEFFDYRDVEAPEVTSCLNYQRFIVLPPTPNNYNLVFHRLTDEEPKKYIFDDVSRTFLMTVETCLYHQGPRNGFVILLDMKGARLGHVFQAKLSFIRKGIRLLEAACPVRIEQIHILNTVGFIDVIMAIVKPVIRSDLLKRVFFHPTSLDYKKFYEIIPKACLPSDYGGDLESVAVLHEKQCKELTKMQEFFHYEGKLLRYELETADIDGHNEK